MITLASQGIVGLNTDYDVKNILQNGNRLIEHDSAIKADGSQIDIVDACVESSGVGPNQTSEGNVLPSLS